MTFCQKEKDLTFRKIEIGTLVVYCVQAILADGNVTVKHCQTVYLVRGTTRQQILSTKESTNVSVTLDGCRTFLKVDGKDVEIQAQ